MDRHAYRDTYPDVKAAAVDPVQHWLEHGLKEGRSLFPRATVVIGENETRRLEGGRWRHFTWRRSRIAIRIEKELRNSLLEQIFSQGRHDPVLFAPGALAIKNLNQFDGQDLSVRDGIDVARLFSAIPECPQVILIIPRLCVGGAEKYVADLVEEFDSFGQTPVLVLVTEASADEERGWESWRVLKPLCRAQVVFWKDECGPGYANPALLARALNAWRSPWIFVVNSRIGLDVVARFGRGLAHYSRVYCAYFSMGLQGLGAPYSTRYPRQTSPYAFSLTDNSAMADRLQQQGRGLPGPGVIELPAKAEGIPDVMFNARLEGRRRRLMTRPNRRWVWISRVEPFKGTALLAEISRQHPTDEIDIYGPIAGNLKGLGLDIPNIRYGGILADVSAAHLSDYDGFLFTSLCEGMPNIVLEIAQHALPMILADVGGLRGTFTGEAVKFVAHRVRVEQTAQAFGVAMEEVVCLPPDEMRARVILARKQADQRHAPEIYRQNVQKAFGIEARHV